MSQMWQRLLAPVGIWLHEQGISSSEKTVKKYYNDLNRSLLLKDLVDILGKLSDGHDHLKDVFKQNAVTSVEGVPRWEEDSFRKWVLKNQPHSVISAFIPALWRVFVYFAGFPFTELIFNDTEGPVSQYQCIDEDGFIRAYSLLALGGVEMLGKTNDGWTPRGDLEKRSSQKSSRLTLLIFNGLKIASPEVDEGNPELVNADLIHHAEKQLMAAIALTQPAPYMSGLSFEQELKGVAGRLTTDNVVPSHGKLFSFAMSKHDLQTFIQLCLLLRIPKTPLKRGLMVQPPMEVRGDIEKLVLVSDQAEILLSARLANVLVQHMLGDVDFITWQSFETFCVAYPITVRSFYQLWTAICVIHPITSSPQDIFSWSLNCIVQCLSFIRPVQFDGLPAAHRSGVDEDERQFQFDLQNATLVADSSSTPALDESSLVERLTNDAWFHFLILSAEEAHETTNTESEERLIIIFTSPRNNQMLLENSPACTTYIWRYGLVQLLPHITKSQTGGLSSSIQNGAIKLNPHDDPTHDLSSIIIDLRNSMVEIEMTDNPFVQLKLKSFTCYQMPGTAVSVRDSWKD